MDKYPAHNCFLYPKRGRKDKGDKWDGVYGLDSIWGTHKAEPVNSGEQYSVRIAYKILSKSENPDKINSVSNEINKQMVWIKNDL